MSTMHYKESLFLKVYLLKDYFLTHCGISESHEPSLPHVRIGFPCNLNCLLQLYLTVWPTL